jgi:hypothetical protein
MIEVSIGVRATAARKRAPRRAYASLTVELDWSVGCPTATTSLLPHSRRTPEFAERVRRIGGSSGANVEVAGIEPASFVVLMGILRAQCAVPLLGLPDPAHEPG